MESAGVAEPVEWGGTAEEGDATDIVGIQAERGAERLDSNGAIGRTVEGDGVEGVAFLGEADILVGERLAQGVFEGTTDDRGGPFAVDTPGVGAVDGFTILMEPSADGAEDLLLFVGDRAVGTGTDVEEEGTVLADDVNEVADDLWSSLVLVMLDVAPGVFGDGSICLPEVGIGIGELSAFDIKDSGVFREGLMFVINRDTLAPGGGAVVVVGGEALKVGSEGRLFDPPVEPEELRLVEVDELTAASEPVVEKVSIGVGVARHGGAVEASVAGILDVGGE